MAIWQWGLLLLGVVWALQSYGVWLQMRHYSDVFKGITEKFTDGYVGAGSRQGRLRKGAIVILVVSSDLKVQRLLVMSGWSVFTKFQRQQQFEDLPLEKLRADPAIFGDSRPGVTAAVAQAVEQIDRKLEAGEEPALAMPTALASA
ncbi:transcriptional regulator GutM [Pseudohoeflea coraliihabitans]|uniref:Transcriptional regulator n=1 Tax=Pseudohoeflea coraliihabitans TaxID=2860393 RepID=A0ABS6WNK8_9HYPH|nr:transcriptional regulator GutM [Pseudohoeflea sp. DP4N28-3]MBW3096690.1 transcriptional regulator [Pseudohoeflea sp. DP4N28-3]